MFLLRQPNAAAIRRFMSEQCEADISYTEAGMTREAAADTPPPRGYLRNHGRTRVGEGGTTFGRACEALDSWRMYDMPWVRIVPSGVPIKVGETVGLVVRHLGFWSLNACRIAYTLDEQSDGVRRYGFGYGTLPEHAETGEERFLIEWNRSDDSVWYELLSFARPGALLSWMGFPVVRLLQRRFARESTAAMRRAVRS